MDVSFNNFLNQGTGVLIDGRLVINEVDKDRITDENDVTMKIIDLGKLPKWNDPIEIKFLESKNEEYKLFYTDWALNNRW